MNESTALGQRTESHLDEGDHERFARASWGDGAAADVGAHQTKDHAMLALARTQLELGIVDLFNRYRSRTLVYDCPVTGHSSAPLVYG
jgi:hypothetical protein